MEIRKNVRTESIEVRGLNRVIVGDEPGWVRLTTEHRAWIRDFCSRRYIWDTEQERRFHGKRMLMGREMFEDYEKALLAHHDRQVDPFLEWLRALPKWDGVQRLPTLIESIFEMPEDSPEDAKDNSDLASWAGMAILMGAVARTLKPGLKHDEVPVLIGPQGCGKSTFVAHLLPDDHRDEWFNDNIQLSGEDKQRVEATLGRVIVEIGEMRGANRGDLASIKAFISADTDRIRLAYRRDVSSIRRRFVMVGTADAQGAFPNDPGGLRRFVPVRLLTGFPWRVRAKLKKDRPQLWAEALHRVETLKEETRLPDGLAIKARQASELERSRDDVAEEMVEKHVGILLETEPRGFTTTAVFKAILGEFSHGAPTQYQVTKVLKSRDSIVEQRRRWVDGRAQRVWVLKGSGEAEVDRKAEGEHEEVPF